jgi:hypothetical protein
MIEPGRFSFLLFSQFLLCCPELIPVCLASILRTRQCPVETEKRKIKQEVYYSFGRSIAAAVHERLLVQKTGEMYFSADDPFCTLSKAAAAIWHTTKVDSTGVRFGSP